jgi:hypothetical protein
VRLESVYLYGKYLIEYMENNKLTAVLLSTLILIVVSFLGYTRITGFATYQYGTTTMNATVGAWVSITPSVAITGGITFGSINPGTNNNTAVNDATGPPGDNCTGYNITVDTSSNVNVDLFNDASGDLDSSGNKIGIGNVTLESNQTQCGENINITATSGGSIQLTTSYLIMGNDSTTEGPCKSVASGNLCHIAYWLNVPSSQVTGTYTTTYKYCGVQEDSGVGSCG